METVLDSPINPKLIIKALPTKGKLVYEYNPFRNYRLLYLSYFYKGNYYNLLELYNLYNIYFSNVLIYKKTIGNIRYYSNKKENGYSECNYLNELNYVYSDSNNISRDSFELALIKIAPTLWEGINKKEDNKKEDSPTLCEKGQLVDFITDELLFSLEHPVHIVPLYSYDGSVNLIINDGINIPRLINSRFSATGKNTYEIIDRKGNNDTNIYDLGDQFDIDTSLYKRVVSIPIINFINVLSGGNLKVGNYHFYFKLADADGNETDFVGESGLVSIFIGFDSPKAVTTGTKNENSLKSVKFLMSNIDSAYNYVYVYYSRTLAEGNENFVTEYIKIEKKYIVNNSAEASILITGFEETTELNSWDINLHYNVVDAVNTSTSCLNMLFLGNVHRPEIPYNTLLNLALRFLPYLKETPYMLDMDKDYNIKSSTKGYIDPKFIYNNTGYWNDFYRFGVVFIMPNNELTSVFNIRGRYKVGTFRENTNFIEGKFNDGQYNHYKLKDEDGKDIIIKIAETTNYIIDPDETEGKLASDKSPYENAKGVVSFSPDSDTNTIYSLDIRVDDETLLELKKYVKGYFFVRQRRIPTILALGITIGIDKESRTPTIPTANGFLSNLKNSLNNTYVETEDLADVNYISEGFLNRYLFDIVAKSSSLWKKIGSTMLKAMVVTATIVGVSMVFPPAAALVGSIAKALALKSLGFYAAAALATAASGVAAGVVTGVGMSMAATVNDVKNIIKRTNETIKLEGRNTKVPEGYKRVETDNSRLLDGDFLDRIIIKDKNSNLIQALLCPDYELNLGYFNQIFTGNEHILRSTRSQNINEISGLISSYFDNDNNHFYVPNYYDSSISTEYTCKIIGVPDSVKLVGIDNLKFRSRAGEAEEVFRYESINKEYENSEDKKTNTDIIRGDFGPYLAISGYPLSPCTTVDILIPGYSEANVKEYIDIRMNDDSSFYAISDRYNILQSDNFLVDKLTGIIGNLNRDCGYSWNLYRGDCYLCQFTHRINRNFQDPSAPFNDEIVDKSTWKDNYDPENVEKYEQINLGDVNAIQLGMWVTFRVRSSNNLNIRTLDSSYVDEAAMAGHERGYFPYLPMSTEGCYKIPESQIYNKGFTSSVSERWNFELPDVPHIKNWFGTRIMYSDIHINDAYKNGYRVFQGTHYRDYTREYGEIVKLVPFESSLLCVFEHGIALIPVNERAVAGEGAGGNVYINTSNVLPENPKIISDMFGSQWAESVLKVPGKTGDSAQYVYGVDTVSKKIWRTDGNTLTCISDFRVQEFLNNNITLGERELTPKIGIRNVKTVYNAYKRDVLFTFYDNTYGFEEKVWNLCWNELLQKFITFYSWVPSYMENINNIPFSFNRDTSKWIAKLGVSHTDNSFADGITLSNVITDSEDRSVTIDGKEYQVTDIPSGFIGVLQLSNRVIPTNMEYTVTYSLLRDLYGNYKMFEIGTCSVNEKTMQCLKFKDGNNSTDLYSELYYRNSAGNSYADDDTNKINCINYDELGLPSSLKSKALSLPIYKNRAGKRVNLKRELMLRPDKIVTLLNIKASILLSSEVDPNLEEAYHNMLAGFESGTSLIDAGYYESVVAIAPKWNLQFLSTDFWKHGQAGLIDIADDIFPTYWYGRQHPFEFECIVVNDPSVHKIFTNLEIVANKAKPESFHYEIIGECYDFAKDKVNMYFRQEAMKALWLYNGADISYNRNFLKVLPRLQPKSADLPHKYYTRQDTINEIEDYYIHITYPENHDYKHLSGAEIVYYPNRQEYRIWNHAMTVSMDDLSLDDARSIIAANCKYLEDRWKVTINPILVCYKNEYYKANNVNETMFLETYSTWTDKNRPKLPVMNSPIPNLAYETISNNDWTVKIPDVLTNLGYSNNDIDLDSWLKDTRIYKYDLPKDSNNPYNYRGDNNRKEIDIKDKFLKVRIRYSGEELAIIDFLNTIYLVSYS